MRPPVTVEQAVAAYAAGCFPMDDADEPELPWYAPDPRTVFELDPNALRRTRRAVRRSLARAQPDWELRVDTAFETVLEACARPRHPDDGVWITPRLAALYRALHAAGFAHSIELHTTDTRLAAGVLAVVVGRAAMLESMFHRVPHTGNVLLVRTLELLAERGAVLCDVQLPTPHTTRLGARPIDRDEYERRLAAALRVP